MLSVVLDIDQSSQISYVITAALIAKQTAFDADVNFGWYAISN